MQNRTARTPAEYLAALSSDRRRELAKVRQVVKRHLPKGYRESIAWGMIAYGIPLKDYPDSPNGQPLCYAALAAQKHHCSLYLMGAYANPAVARALKDGFARAGKKLDMGKSCIRFKTAAELPLDVIGAAVASTPPKAMIALVEQSRRGPARRTR